MRWNVASQARNKGYYTALSQQALGETLDFPTDYFDAVVLSGVFIRGHTSSSSYDDELLRITKPDGYLVFTLRSELYHDESDFKIKMTTLEQEGKWALIENDGGFQSAPGITDKAHVKLFVYRVK